jgi:hypothetical protein
VGGRNPSADGVSGAMRNRCPCDEEGMRMGSRLVRRERITRVMPRSYFAEQGALRNVL